MKLKAKLSWSLLFNLLVINVNAASTSFPSVQKFSLTNPSPSALSATRILVAEGLELDLRSYVVNTSFKNRPDFTGLFSRKFEARYLAKPPVYKEQIESFGDRIRVTRTLELKLKKPCNECPHKTLQMVCFKKQNKPMSKELRADLAKLRAKLKSKPKGITVSNKVQRSNAEVSRLSDQALLQYLLNEDDTHKTIIQETYIPLAV
ncbi:hypothetical protein [Alteromonas lipolytica]|uniref:Uncharacterized protein n=1 Tax=Alteromonas lipolytica TaxID=1856405 RepID=A0A1E8FHB1_9ALTE|nr:hypothetical protein [Alteromonas lipolytica]OFI35311.1 hypothetical protein BFC17_17420 [Alteromonas lipolytica]GGF58502.1 hypothetical protein GCM10011338_08460 [Alteromonas lipolytica]